MTNLALVYPVPPPTPSQAEPPLSPLKAAALANIFDIVILWVDAMAINPKRGIWGTRWHPTAGDQILTDHIAWFRAAGLTRQVYKWSWVPAHGTIDGTIMFQEYTYGASPWICDENGDALVPGRNDLDKTLPFVLNPTRVNPQWVRQYRQHAMIRYGANFEAWIDFNEPDDGFSNPGMVALAQDAGLRRIFEDVYRPAANVHLAVKLPVANIGPEAAYDDGQWRLLEMEHDDYLRSGSRVWNVSSFHAYPPNDNQTVDGALDELAKRRPIVLDARGKADAWMTEIHDSGKGWFPEYFRQAPSVYPELGVIAWLHNDETIFTPESIRNGTYELSEWGEMLAAAVKEQRRRAVQP